MCGVDKLRDFAKRALVLLLSGTPIEGNIKKDLVPVLQLVRRAVPNEDVDDLQDALNFLSNFEKAENQMYRNTSDEQRFAEEERMKHPLFYRDNIKGKTTAHIEKVIRDARTRKNEAYVKLLRGGWIRRGYSSMFLGLPISVTRPGAKVHPPSFVPLPEVFRQKADEQQRALGAVIEQLRRESQASVAKAKKPGKQNTSTNGVEKRLHGTTEFNVSSKCCILPGIFNMAEAMGLDANKVCVADFIHGGNNPNRDLISDNIKSATCGQLTALLDIVSRQCVKRAGLIVANSPLVAFIVHTWLDQQPNVQSKLIDVHVSPTQRGKFITDMRDEVERKPDCNYVLVSTYSLISTGIDGVQKFADYFVSFGSPFLQRDLVQAISRVRRPGSHFSQVDVFGIHGEENSIDHNYYLKIQSRKGLLPEDSLLQLALEAIPIDDDGEDEEL
jgi:hypothetical protein